MTDSETGTASEPSERFRAAIDRWKSQLLDLSGRNRALNYKPRKAVTINLERAVAELWDELVVKGGTVPVRGRPVTENATDPESSLDRVIRWLGERARIAREEQGVEVLYVALGWLDWFDRTKNQGYRAPLVMVPVRLSVTGRSITMLEGDEPELNPALVEYLRQFEDLVLPDFLAAMRDAGGEAAWLASDALDGWFASVATAVAGRQGFGVVTTGATLDVFWFRKVALVQAMTRSLGRLATHPLVRHLAGDGAGLAPLPPLPPTGEAPGHPAEARANAVLPADASQAHAIDAAAGGTSMVIQGPPGTGKSQTIANLIASYLARGQSVLFVAEKAVARTVVIERLQEVGLGDTVLHVQADSGSQRGPAAAKRAARDQLLAAFEQGPRVAAPADAPARAAADRLRAEEHARAVHRPLGSDGWTTPHRVIGEALLAPAPLPTAALAEPAATSNAWWRDAQEALAVAAGDGDDRASLLNTPLAWFRTLPWEGNGIEAIRAALGTVTGSAAELRSLLQPSLGPADPPVDQQPVAVLASFTGKVEAVADHERARRGPLRLLRPAFYRTRDEHKAHLAAARPILGDEAERAAKARSALNSLQTATTALTSHLGTSGLPGENLGAHAAWAEATVPLLQRWPDLARVRQHLETLNTLGLGGCAEDLLRSGAHTAALPALVPAALWNRWATDLTRRADDGPARRRLRANLAVSEAGLRVWARDQALAGASQRRPSPSIFVPPDSELGAVLRWARAKRAQPLRSVLSGQPATVLRLTPCLVMSPLSVAQYLCRGTGPQPEFDVCIVDEASMIPTADVVLALSLAKQAIICGDSKQMPPTSFFERMVDLAAPEAEDEEPPPDFESILDQAATMLPAVSLRWHYRSRDESLIAFSNGAFYGGSLETFPAPFARNPDGGVRHEFVPEAVYGRGGTRANEAEARRVVELLAEELTAFPNRDVAITAMSIAQQDAINAEIDRRLLELPALRAWQDAGGRAKNLETIQGDECDTMILSLGYGRDAEGRLFLNFGPLAREGGERRLNVAVTRARWRTILVSSIRAGEIPTERVTTRGATGLRDYLEYAERGAAAGRAEGAAAGPFESAVIDALRGAGQEVHASVGLGSYRIDAAVADPAKPGRYLLAVETDGATAARATATDREVTRPVVLERMGWQVHPVSAEAWYLDPAGELRELLDAIARAGSASPSPEGPEPEPPAAPAPPQLLEADGRGERFNAVMDNTTAAKTRLSADISVREAAYAIVHAVANAGPTDESNAAGILREAFGFGRASRQLADKAADAVAWAVANGYLEREGTILHPLAR